MKNFVRAAAMLVIVVLAACGTSTNTNTNDSTTAQRPPTTTPATAQLPPTTSTVTAQSSRPAPDTVPPKPSGPFISTPSDLIAGVWVLGTVTRGGPGPCYGFTADDGRDLALRGATVGALTAGDRIRVLVRPDELSADCGSGEPMIVMDVKRAG